MFAQKPVAAAVALALLPMAALAEGEVEFRLDATATQLAVEAIRSPFVNQIKANYAHNAGAKGSGLVVGVVDTGLNTATGQLSGRIVRGYNFLANNTSTTDEAGHGTHVAGIVAAARDGVGMYGVAPAAKVMSLKVFGTGSTDSTTVDRALRYAVGKAKVLNMSFGGAAAPDTSAYQAAINGGLLLVASSGNNGWANPAYPARFAKESWAKGQMIAVGAVDANNTITWFSNRAGDTKDYYLVAPGSGIYSTYLNGTYTSLSGTSMAAPQVSGAAAVIWARWPRLTAAQVTSILLNSATDLGAPGADEVYGRGLLNLQNAMAAQGVVTSPTGSGSGTLSGSYISPAAAFRASISQASTAGLFQVVGFDSYGRDYHFDLGKTVAPAASLSLTGVLGNGERMLGLAERVLPDGAGGTRRLVASLDNRWTPHAQAREGPPATSAVAAYERGRSPLPRMGGFSLTSQGVDGREWSVGANGFATRYFGLAGAAAPELTTSLERFGNPYMNLVANHNHFASGFSLGQGTTLKMGLVNSAGRSLATQLDEGAAHKSLRASMVMAELAHKTDSAVVSGSVARLNEQSGLLGGASGSLFALGASPNTTVTNLQAAWTPAPDLALAASVSLASTASFNNPANSLVAGVSNLRSRAATLGLVKSSTWLRDDRMTLTVSSPMRATAGVMTFDLPKDVDAQGNVVRARHDVSLKPQGMERRYEATYTLPTREGGWMFGLVRRLQPDHDRSAAPENMAAVRYTRSF